MRKWAKMNNPANYTNISASAQISARPCRLRGFMINSCAAGATLKIWDQTSAAVPILLNTMTFSATPTTGLAQFPDGGIDCKNGLYVTIAVAAMDITIFWD